MEHVACQVDWEVNGQFAGLVVAAAEGLYASALGGDRAVERGDGHRGGSRVAASVHRVRGAKRHRGGASGRGGHRGGGDDAAEDADGADLAGVADDAERRSIDRRPRCRASRAGDDQEVKRPRRSSRGRRRRVEIRPRRRGRSRRVSVLRRRRTDRDPAKVRTRRAAGRRRFRSRLCRSDIVRAPRPPQTPPRSRLSPSDVRRMATRAQKQI
mmetsp:Transcript_16713/g.52266  ORF Transcript_16713/g.52266 Transcript_16713/m.52266 type:complete len:212 (-) Transcript_16713:524-1159(-)